MGIKLQKGLEPGWHVVTVASVEEKELKFGRCVKLAYEAEDGKASEICNLSYTPRTKFGSRVKAILGHLPDDLEYSDLEGCQVVIKLDEQENSDFLKVTDAQRYEAEDEDHDDIDINEINEDDVPF